MAGDEGRRSQPIPWIRASGAWTVRHLGRRLGHLVQRASAWTWCSRCSAGCQGTISTLPMMVFKRGADGSRAPAPEHPLYQLLHRKPNRVPDVPALPGRDGGAPRLLEERLQHHPPGPGRRGDRRARAGPPGSAEADRAAAGRPALLHLRQRRRRRGRDLPRRPGLAHQDGAADQGRPARPGGVRDLARDLRAGDRGGAVRRALLRQRRLRRRACWSTRAPSRTRRSSSQVPGDLAHPAAADRTATRTGCC